MTYVRWFGLLFAIVSVAIQPEYPDAATRRNAWVLVAVLAVGSTIIWGLTARTRSESEQRRLGAAAFAFDAIVIASLIWTYSFEDPYVTWALAYVVPLEGALRYKLQGALLAAGGLAGFFAVQTFHRADVIGGDFDTATFIFVTGLGALVAGVTGAMANQWSLQSRALEDQSLQLAEIDRLKDRFLAVTSHEIRGPLTAIIAGIDTVRSKVDRITPEQHDRVLEMVSQQGHQLARLVDDLQVTSQIQSRQLALHPHWTDVENTIHQALEAAASKRRQHQLELFTEPFECEVDASRLGQIIRNLVENAYKYTPDRTRVSVTARRDDHGLVLEVADEGTGIPADKRDQLFGAFSRIEETSAGQEGVGLGLYVVSQLVAAMKGQIDLTSSERGTTFTIAVPCDTRRADGSRHLGLVEDQ